MQRFQIGFLSSLFLSLGLTACSTGADDRDGLDGAPSMAEGDETGDDDDVDVDDDDLPADGEDDENMDEPDGGTTGGPDVEPDDGTTGDDGVEPDPTDDGGTTGDAGDTGEDPTDGGTTGDTGEPNGPQAPADGDSPANPAVIAQFRYTSPAPVAVTGALFNLDPIDTKGLQYIDELSSPDDERDWVQFSIVPGEVDPTIRITLDCDEAGLSPQPLSAVLIDDDGAEVETIACGEGTQMITLHNASSLDVYQVRVQTTPGVDHYDGYALSIDAYCFQGCNFQPL